MPAFYEKKISVIVPAYNVEQYIEKCVKSIINQTYHKLEIILVDDGSTDSTGAICDMLGDNDDRILVIHKDNGGSSSARNAGINISTGEYILFIDGDDYFSPECIEDLFLIADKNPRIVASNVYDSVDFTGNVLSTYTYDQNALNGMDGYSFFRQVLYGRLNCSICNKLFPAEMVKRHLFVESISNEDILYIYDIICDMKGIQFSNYRGYNYLIRKDSLSHKFGKEAYDSVLNARKIQNDARINHPELRTETERYLCHKVIKFLKLYPRKQHPNDFFYDEVVKEIKENSASWLQNPLLTKKERVLVIFFTILPKTANWVFAVRKKIRDC